jgi:hypothetical protein
MRYLILGLLVLSLSAQASSTLRVGSRVLVAGDSTMRAVELLGKPAHKSHHRASRKGRRGGVVIATPASEQWQYRRGDHTTILTIVDGRITDIDDRRR